MQRAVNGEQNGHPAIQEMTTIDDNFEDLQLYSSLNQAIKHVQAVLANFSPHLDLSTLDSHHTMSVASHYIKLP